MMMLINWVMKLIGLERKKAGNCQETPNTTEKVKKKKEQTKKTTKKNSKSKKKSKKKFE